MKANDRERREVSKKLGTSLMKLEGRDLIISIDSN